MMQNSSVCCRRMSAEVANSGRQFNWRKAAFEGRLRDMKTGEVVSTFADRDMQDVGPLDLMGKHAYRLLDNHNR